MRRRNPDAGLVVFWVKLMQRGYRRSIPGLYRFLKKQGIMAVKPLNPKYIPKPYEQMDYPGQRIQVDVKFVPSACLKNSRVIGKQFFQYTAIDEYSRWRFVEAFEEHSSYSSAMFVEHLVKAFPCRINAYRRTTVQNLLTVLPHKKINLLFFRRVWSSMESTISLSGLLHPGTMEKWSAVTGKTMNVSMPPTCFILLRTLQRSLKYTTVGIIIIFQCVRWDGKHRIKYSGIIYAQCNKCLTNLQSAVSANEIQSIYNLMHALLRRITLPTSVCVQMNFFIFDSS